jgi:hypothetical protein
LTVEGGGTLRLNSDAAVQGDLLVAANGLLDINTRSLAVGGSVTNNGGLRQTRDTPNTMTTSFLTIPTGKYYGVDIYPTSGDMGATTVTVYGNQTCLNGGTSAVNRCYEIDPGTDQTADITYYYRDAEENGQDAAEIWHWNGASWNQETCIGRDPSGVEDNWIRAGGVDEYSPFLLSNSNPTAVELVRFEATPSGNNIQIEWETASEIDNLGFNLYRAESAPGGTRICLNADLIPSEAPGSPTGAVYTWVDESIALDTTYYYWLEDVDIYGETTLHGPASATAAESPVHRIYLPLVVR